MKLSTANKLNDNYRTNTHFGNAEPQMYTIVKSLIPTDKRQLLRYYRTCGLPHRVEQQNDYIVAVTEHLQVY